MMSEQARQSRDDGPQFGLDIAVLVLALAFFVGTAFETTELFSQRSQLSTVRANQEQPLAELAKVQGMVQAMAADTIKLSDSGNATAKEILENLAKQGIKFNLPQGQH